MNFILLALAGVSTIACTINLENIKKSKNSKLVHIEEDNFMLNKQLILNKPLNADISLEYNGVNFDLQGSLKTEIKAKCCRCLQDVIVPVEIFFNEKLIYSGDINKANLSVEDVAENFFVYEKEIYDLSDIIRENIFSALPLKILCSEGCKGLCPNCGQNLNIKKCNCSTDEIDPRFAILAKLKEV